MFQRPAAGCPAAACTAIAVIAPIDTPIDASLINDEDAARRPRAQIASEPPITASATLRHTSARPTAVADNSSMPTPATRA
jgi:hypothetical protein